MPKVSPQRKEVAKHLNPRLMLLRKLADQAVAQN